MPYQLRTQRVVKFITNYAEVNAVALPGQIPGHKDYNILLLPSRNTKKSIWEKYYAAAEQDSHRAVGLTTFENLWMRYKPGMEIAKPRSDLC